MCLFNITAMNEDLTYTVKFISAKSSSKCVQVIQKCAKCK